ncbi:unnamed protein product [Urochloa decumbens]|uniref:Uncharacterized protein n=1 Tax=Urochloa decumbens TaxID=240449 RepID=A0ABC8YTZ9_9POAL
MRGRSCSCLEYVMVIFLFVLLFASPAKCRRLEARSVEIFSNNPANASNNATLNFTGFDESMVTVIFCFEASCTAGACYCCLKNFDVCYDSMDKCWANCPLCNPKCPPSSLEDQPLYGTMNSTIHK